MKAACDKNGAEEGDGHEQRTDVERLRVDRCDDDEGNDVVDDDEREHERTQSVGKAWADERQNAERERGVGRHRDPPTGCG